MSGKREGSPHDAVVEGEAKRVRREETEGGVDMLYGLSALEARAERERIAANILHALDADTPASSSSSSSPEFAVFSSADEAAAFKYQSLPCDPKTSDAEAVHVDTLFARTTVSAPASRAPSVAPFKNGTVSGKVSDIFAMHQRKMPPPLPGRETGTPPRFSDGLASTHPQESKTTVNCDLDKPDDADAVLIAANWCAKLGLMGGFPPGYRLVSLQTNPSSGPRWDSYLFGHPSGKRYRSPNEFIPHLAWMCSSDSLRACFCKPCGGESIKDTSSLQYLDVSRGEVAEETVGVELTAKEEADLPEPSNESLTEEPVAIAVEEQMPPTSIDMASIAPRHLPPVPEAIVRATSLDEDWNGEDYDSDEDASYAESYDGRANSDDNTSDEDDDDMNDDDDDASGNESEEDNSVETLDRSSEDEMERETFFPDLDSFNAKRSAARKKDSNLATLEILDPSILNSSHEPVRKSEVAWYPSARLDFHPPPVNTESFLQRMPMWPVLVLNHPNPLNVSETTIIPLPVPTPSEIQVLTANSIAATYPHIVPRSSIRTSDTPSHYTPYPSKPPIFGPRSVPTADLVPWRQIDPAPPHHTRKYMSTDSPWQRRWNRGVIQAVGASSTWEPVQPHLLEGEPETLDELGTVWRELRAGVRCGVEVVRAGDWVHLVLPSPIVESRRGGSVSGSARLGSAKHRLMKVDRIAFRSPANRRVEPPDREGEGEGIEVAAALLAEARKRVGKVIVEGDVYAFRAGVGWFLLGRKRCTMRKVLMGRRFGSEEYVPGSKEIDEVGGGFGHVGLVANESRGYWDGWVSCKAEEDGPSAWLETVRALEGYEDVEGAPEEEYDFNYSEPNTDEEDVERPERSAFSAANVVIDLKNGADNEEEDLDEDDVMAAVE
ncbi:hypothetical protein BC830DRAFT_1152693 [Chytriomyces sp. MP71]|nr:hypothetical protein BC830DRAFT_1152693 [Chytriomyces sp. MP71]